MIKIAVIALGKNIYNAFSLNQEYPVATTYRGTWSDTKEDVEKVFISRFHSQRLEWKKMGKDIPPLEKTGVRRGGWKFIWKNTANIFDKPAEQIKVKPQVETLVSEPGLTITKEKPIFQVAAETAAELEPMYVAKKLEHGFNFEPISDDVIPESKIPEYIRTHKD